LGGVSHYFDNDDKDSTRTLFVGNLDNDIERDFLRHLFSRFGIIEEIDVKRNMPVQPLSYHDPNNLKTYAFVRFQNLDMAVAAKVQMNGKRLNGRNECKIGYGNNNNKNNNNENKNTKFFLFKCSLLDFYF